MAQRRGENDRVVLDYRGAPYLRFTRAGILVNNNSAMDYLNQTPVAETPPANINASTHPDWRPVSSSHEYNWHDGRLHALATIALAPGAKYVGNWSIPILIDGRRTAISGGAWHADRPSIIWFWPIVVLPACMMPATRIRRSTLDARLARALGAIRCWPSQSRAPATSCTGTRASPFSNALSSGSSSRSSRGACARCCSRTRGTSPTSSSRPARYGRG